MKIQSNLLLKGRGVVIAQYSVATELNNICSVNFNNNKNKSLSTLTGKMKYLESINFKPEIVNTFDIQAWEGMKQVAMINE